MTDIFIYWMIVLRERLQAMQQINKTLLEERETLARGRDAQVARRQDENTALRRHLEELKRPLEDHQQNKQILQLERELDSLVHPSEVSNVSDSRLSNWQVVGL